MSAPEHTVGQALQKQGRSPVLYFKRLYGILVFSLGQTFYLRLQIQRTL